MGTQLPITQHQHTTPTLPTNQHITMDSVKNAANSAAETVQQGLRGTSKEANKEVAKDSNAPVGTRASAAKDAVSDKAQEEKHSGKSEATSRTSKLLVSAHEQ